MESFYKKLQELSTAQSLAANFASGPGEIKEVHAYSVFVVITAATGLSGTFQLQASPDGVNWANVPGANATSVLASVAAAETIMLFDSNVSIPSYPYVQVTFTHTAGTGTANIFLSCKQ
jgi:hypothetical protein